MGLLHGDLLAWTGTPRAGQFTFRTAAGQTYFCTYDDKTYFERDSQRIAIAGLEKDDRLELVTDSKQGSSQCYARTVHVLNPPRTRVVPGLRPRERPAPPPVEIFGPRGNLTFSGIVLRVTPDTMILKSRSGERQNIRLRPDTRYLTEGQASDIGSLRANTMVFVRAGKNLDDEVEAYQVVWGSIMQSQE